MANIPWFYTALPPEGLQLTLDETNSRHAVQVLRMEAGAPLVLTNGQGGLWQATVINAHKKHCEVTITHAEEQPRTGRRVGIAISPVKNNTRLEWFIEKATELGVHDVYLLQAHRTEKPHIRFDRLLSIAISAMLQSQQPYIPNLHPAKPFQKWVPACGFTHRFVAHCLPTQKTMLAAALQPTMQDSLVLIGPEGDFTEEEIKLALEHQYQPVALGQTRLRTETAALAAATLCVMG